MSYDDYDNDSEVDLFIPTPTDHSFNSNTQDKNISNAMSSSSSRPFSPLNNHSYHSSSFLQSQPTPTPASTISYTHHQHDTSSPPSSSSVHLKTN